MTINKRIHTLRKKNKLTQQQLASRVDVSPQVISNWERNYTSPDYDDVIKLSKVLECSADYLLGRIDEERCTSTTIQKTLRELINDGNLKLPEGIDLPHSFSEDDLRYLEELFETALMRIQRKYRGEI